MTKEELEQAAIECLAGAFRGNSGVPAHVVQAAVALLAALAPVPPKPADESL